MNVNIRGKALTRTVWLDGRRLLPEKSQKVYNHSPDGFNWGYCGSGPAQLALAVLISLTDERTAQRNYQDFKTNVIATLPAGEDFDLDVDVSPYLTMKQDELFPEIRRR